LSSSCHEEEDGEQQKKKEKMAQKQALNDKEQTDQPDRWLV
jgi:hypothetical protein